MGEAADGVDNDPAGGAAGATGVASLSDDAEARMVRAALELAAERGWRTLALAEVAERAGLSLLDAYRVVPSKASLLASLMASTDRAVLAHGPVDPADPVRDRLFEILMRRLDALQAQRAGMVAILRDLRRDPLSAVWLPLQLGRSFAWMLEAAGVSSAGVAGALKANALAITYLNALRVWIDDDTPDMARTMAALDKGLAQLEQVADRLPESLLQRQRRRGPDVPPSPPPPAPPPPAPPESG